MKLLIAIPSKGRAKEIYKHTLRWVTRTGYDVRVFVEPQDIESYKTLSEDANYKYRLDINDNNFVDIGANDRGLGFAKQKIKEYAEANGYDLIFKMDDDVLRFNSRGRNKPDDLMILQFCEMVGLSRITFGKYPDLGAITFPYRNELFESRIWTAINARLQTCYLIRTEYLQAGFNTLEDFAQYIYLRSQNKITLRYGMLGIDCSAVGKNKGGLQTFDRQEQAKAEIDDLRKIYPALEFHQGKQWLEPVLKGDFFDMRNI